MTETSRSSATLRAKTRFEAREAFTDGRTTIGIPDGVSSASRPSANVSLMLAAHLLIVL